MTPAFQRTLHGALAEDWYRTGGRRDHDVGVGQVRRDLGEADRIGIELLRQFLCPCDGPVGDDDAPDAVLHEVPCGQLDRLTGTDQHCGLLGQIGKDLACQADGGKCDRNRAIADRGIRAHPLGGGEGVLKEPSEHLAAASGVARRLKGALDLTEDLRLAEYQGVEAAGDRQQVINHATSFERVQVGRDVLDRQSVEPGQPFACRLD